MEFREWRDEKIKDAVNKYGKAYEIDIRLAYNEREFELRELYRDEFEEKSKPHLEEFFDKIEDYIEIK